MSSPEIIEAAVAKLLAADSHSRFLWSICKKDRRDMKLVEAYAESLDKCEFAKKELDVICTSKKTNKTEGQGNAQTTIQD